MVLISKAYWNDTICPDGTMNIGRSPCTQDQLLLIDYSLLSSVSLLVIETGLQTFWFANVLQRAGRARTLSPVVYMSDLAGL